MVSDPRARTFQSAPPRRGRLRARTCMREKKWFQSAPPRRGRHESNDDMALPFGFQSAPPRRGRRAHADTLSGMAKFQSAPPRRGRPAAGTVRNRASAVSIRAPAKGATLRTCYMRLQEKVFQSAPPRRGRPSPPSGTAARRRFNPRPREGGDAPASTTAQGGGVSIRAPAKGATFLRVELDPIVMFQSAPPRRGRPRCSRRCIGSGGFQSAPPRRGRHDTLFRALALETFQSAPPRRGRHVGRTHRAAVVQFQSAPPRRGRPRALIR